MTATDTPAPPLPRLTGSDFSVRPAEPDGVDLNLLHGWMRQTHVATFWQQDWSRDRWAAELRRQRAGVHSLPCLVGYRGSAFAYLEVYRVVRDPLARYYHAGPADLGVHVAIGDPTHTGRGLGAALLRAVAGGLLAAEDACARVVAEPDVRNLASLGAFRRAGFRRVAELALPDKTAALLVCPRHPKQAGELPGERS
jgi:RimJ/RimL family protein N-acetyltransferase